MCENTENFDNIEEEKTKVASNDEKEYSIYNYFKEHPSIFIAVISTLVAVISGAIRIISNIAITSELKSWGINTDYIEINTNQFDVIVVVLACLLISTMIQLTISDKTDIFKKKRELQLIGDAIEQSIHNLSNVYLEQESETENLKFKELKEETGKLLETAQDTVKIGKSYLKFIIPILLMITVFVQWLMIYVFYGRKNFIYAVIVTVIIALFGFFSSYMGDKRIKEKELKNKTFLELVALEREKIEEYNNMISEMLFFNFKRNNSNFKILMKFVAFLMSVGLSIIMIFFVKVSSDAQNNFNIVTIDNNQYAVIYTYDNKYYLEEAKIDGKRITINTTNQRILVSEDISIQNMTFEEVEKIKQQK